MLYKNGGKTAGFIQPDILSEAVKIPRILNSRIAATACDENSENSQGLSSALLDKIEAQHMRRILSETESSC